MVTFQRAEMEDERLALHPRSVFPTEREQHEADVEMVGHGGCSGGAWARVWVCAL